MSASLAIPQELFAWENSILKLLNMSANNFPKDHQGSDLGPFLFYLYTKSKGLVIKSQVTFMSSHYRLQGAQFYTLQLDSNYTPALVCLA